MSLKNLSTGFLATLCSTFAMAQGSSHSQITLSGTVSGELSGYDKLYVFIGHDDRDSTTIRDGHYSYTCTFKDQTYIMILPEATLKSNHGYSMNPVLTDQPGAYTINLEMPAADDRNRGYQRLKMEVSGTEATTLYESFKQQQNEIYKKAAASTIESQPTTSQPTTTQSVQPSAATGTTQPSAATRPASAASAPASADTAKTGKRTFPAQMVGRSMMNPQNDLSRQYMIPLVQDFVKAHPDSYASLFILQTTGLSTLNMEQQEESYALLSDKIKNTPDGKHFYDHIQGDKKGRVGNSVTPFTLGDPNGNKIDLASFKGKYVLIDFWASWCGPCRKSFPYMRKLYSAYKSPSFEMYSISIDKKKNDWLKAVKEENNPWPQSLDTIDISAAGFGIAGVPTAILLDPQGKIVARETGVATDGTDGIEKKLAELFGKKM